VENVSCGVDITVMGFAAHRAHPLPDRQVFCPGVSVSTTGTKVKISYDVSILCWLQSTVISK